MSQALLITGLSLAFYSWYSRLELKRWAHCGMIDEHLSQLNIFIPFFTTGYLGVSVLMWNHPSATLLLKSSCLEQPLYQ